jgi:hypothetical protein
MRLPVINLRSLQAIPTTLRQSAHTAAAGMGDAHRTTAPSPTTQPSAAVAPDEKKLPLLIEPRRDGDQETLTLDVSGDGGATLKLDHLGPMVVHRDGTISRISNWTEMSEIERQNTLRVLGKRNQLRLASLKENLKENSKDDGQPSS